MADLHVHKAGWQTTVQDLGRRGFSRAGLSSGGALDEHAYLWANKLLDNSLNAACIEVLMGQFEAEFDTATTIAVTGADLGLRLNGKAQAHWCSFRVQPGDRLQMETPRNGLRAYMGVVGGWQTPLTFNSRSTVLREQLGGLDGKALSVGQRLAYSVNITHDVPLRCLNPRYIPDYQAPLSVKVIPGYQYDRFSEVTRQRFFTSEYRVSQRIDRMGYRLEGPAVQANQAPLVSEGIAYGAIQIPQDGQPIVLLKDRQTIGGYPKMGCLSSLECSRLSQRAPGSSLAFELSHVATVQAERQLFDRFFQAGIWHASGRDVHWP